MSEEILTTPVTEETAAAADESAADTAAAAAADTAQAAGETTETAAPEAPTPDAGKTLTEEAAEVVEKIAQSAGDVLKKAVSAVAQEIAQAADAVEKKAADTISGIKEAATETGTAPSESMADYDAAITASMKPIHEGDILKGTIIGISDEELTVDLGIYTDGVVRLEDASDDPSFTFRSFEIGQPVSATVIRRDNAQGRIQLSLKAAASVLGWERLQQLLKDQSNITVKINEAVKGGVTTFVEGIRGFIPASKLSLNYVENLDEFVGREIEVRVITADPEQKRLVLSARDILREKAQEERKHRISNVQIGLVTEGTVESLMPYGAFINLGNGLSGLVHVSQISQERIKHPSVVLKEGQKVKVKVIGVKDGKISLSMKALEDTPAEAIEEETYRLPKAENATTSLASLFKNIKL